MKRTVAQILTVTGSLIIVLNVPLTAETKANQPQIGRVLAAGISGYGSRPDTRSNRIRKGDTWWTYCVSAQDQVYSVVSREGPARTGLKVGNQVRFQVDRNQVYVLDTRGKRHSLRILRRTKTEDCP